MVTAQLGERSLAAKGMTGLSSIRIAEVQLARTRREEEDSRGNLIPEAAMQLLDPYRFHSVG